MSMRWSALALVLLGVSGCKPPQAADPVAGPAAPPQEPLVASARPLRPQPKPGERVRQPELDGYCGQVQRSLAFYYHGGSPVVQVARKDDCAPLYISECEEGTRCSAPRDQEPGMWCCGTPGRDLPAHAER